MSTASLLRLMGFGCCTVLVGVGAGPALAATDGPARNQAPQIDRGQPAQDISRAVPARVTLTGVAAVAAAAAEIPAPPAITGVVTGSNGATVSGYLVEAFTSDGNFVEDATTARDGRYSFTGLKAGPYRLRFSGPAQGAAPWAMAWNGGVTAMSKAGVVVVGAAPLEVDVRLPRAAAVQGTVSGVPAGSEVRVCGDSFLDCRVGSTDASGRFTIRGLAAGRDSIVVRTQGGSDVAFPKDPPRYGVTLRANRTTDVILDAVTQAEPQVTIAGKVIRPALPRPLRDRTRPKVTGTKITSQGEKRYVTVSADDGQGGSGLQNVQIRIGTTRLAPTRYTQAPLAAPGTAPVSVRVQDKAGNYSTWQVAK